MSFYAYSAIAPTGQLVKGRMESDSPESASRELSSRGLYPVSLRQTSHQLARLLKSFQALRVNRGDFIEFAQNLSVMLKAGMPMLTSLEDLIASCGNKTFKSVLQDVKQVVERGGSVSAALEAQGALFPHILRTLVSVGEQTGRFDESLREAAEHLLRLQGLAGALKQAMLYPLFAMTTTGGALVFWLVFVLPKMIVTMKSMGVKLPPLTLLLISAGNLFQAHWLLLLLSPGVAAVGIFLAGKHPRVRYLRDLALVRLPIVRLIIYNKSVAVFAEQFRILVVAGMSIDRIFDLIVPTVGNEYFAVNLRDAKKNIMDGSPVSQALDKGKFLPLLAIRMIGIGENSGTLDSQLDFLARHFTKKLDDATAIMGKLVEPVVMVVVGGLFALIIMGLLLPMYDLVSQIGR